MVLWVFWVIEALIIVGAPAFFALTFAESPFCEKCTSWCKEHFGIIAIEAVDKEEFTRRLQQFDIDFIAAIPPASKGTMSLLRFDLYSCPCRQTNTLSVMHINRLIKKGKEEVVQKYWIFQALVADHQAQALRRLGAPVA